MLIKDNGRLAGRTRTFRWIPIGLILLTSLIGGVVRAGDFDDQRRMNWHQWRGPDATGVAPSGQPPIEWSPTKNLKWKAEIPGRGKSTPIVWGKKVFITTAIDTGKIVESAAKPEDQPERQFGIKFPNTLYRFVVLCLDRDTGKVLWEKTAVEELPHEGHHGDNSHASASPFTDGKAIYISFGSRGLYSYDMDGNLRWARKLDSVSTRLSFGEGSSPVAHGDVVILNRDNETNSYILAVDANTGDERWKVAREESSSWATPIIVEQNGRTQVISNASKLVRSYDLATGELLWTCGGQVANVTPSPVLLGQNVICMSGYRGSAAISIPIDSSGDLVANNKISWKFEKDTPYVPSPLLYGNQLYFNKLNNGILTCLDATTGKPILESLRMPGLSNIYASPVGAADRVYFVGRDGVTLVLKKSTTFEVLATNSLEDSIDASPAIAGNQLFLRGQNHLYCLQSQ